MNKQLGGESAYAIVSTTTKSNFDSVVIKIAANIENK